jgi:spermidine synthase
VSAVSAMSGAFPVVSAYVVAVPGYFGGHMTLGWASQSRDALDVPVDELRQRFARADIATRYYTPEVHAAGFALPRYILEALDEGLAADR